MWVRTVYRTSPPVTNTMASSTNNITWRQREAFKAQKQKDEAHRKQTEKTETNFPSLVALAHRIHIAPQGFAEKADAWRVEQELKSQMDAYRKAKTARERRTILNTVYIFQQRGNADGGPECRNCGGPHWTLTCEDQADEEEFVEQEEDPMSVQFPPHGRRGTYTAPDSEGWRFVIRRLRVVKQEKTEDELHQMYVARGNDANESEADVNADLTDRNQRRQFY